MPELKLRGLKKPTFAKFTFFGECSLPVSSSWDPDGYFKSLQKGRCAGLVGLGSVPCNSADSSGVSSPSPNSPDAGLAEACAGPDQQL